MVYKSGRFAKWAQLSHCTVATDVKHAGDLKLVGSGFMYYSGYNKIVKIYSVQGTGVLSPGVKRGRGRDADHSPPSNAEVVNE
jgi:hypothetical protein